MYVSSKEKENVPQHTCRTCTKCVNKHCTFYNRRVEPYNRCFNHSNYHTVATKYQTPQQLEEIKEEYERRITA